MAKRKSKFGANVVADVDRRKKEGSAYGYLNLPKGLSMFKEGEGRVRLDIIPYEVTDKSHLDLNPDGGGLSEVGDPWYKKPILVHRNVGADNETIVCPKTVGKKCPICEHREQQFRDGMDKDDVVPKAKLRNLYLVIPVGHKEYDEEVHLWDISNYLFQEKLDDELGEDPDNGIFPDLEEGKTLKIRFSEESYNKNKFYETSRIDFEERDEQYEDDLMDDSPNLDEIFTLHSYKKLQAMFFEMEEEDLEDEKEETDDIPFDEDSPKPRKKKSLKKKKKEEEPEEEEEEEEETPKRKKKKSKPAPEPEEEEEEEEEEQPKRKKKKAKKDECPEGHTFGKDWDEEDDCNDCPLFDSCGEANEEY